MYNKSPCTHLSDPTLSPNVLKSRFQIKCLFSLSIIQHTYLTEKGIKKKKKERKRKEGGGILYKHVVGRTEKFKENVRDTEETAENHMKNQLASTAHHVVQE